MLTSRQICLLIVIGLGLWGLETLYIRLVPQAFVDPVWGVVMFFAAPISIWLNIALVRQLAGLSRPQVLPGVALVAAVALMAEGLGLRLIPAIVDTHASLLRSGAAWVQWGYGISLLMALFISRTPPEPAP